MGGTMWALPVVWAQATAAPSTGPPSLAPLALRRWCGSLTLSSPDAVPNLSGLWIWLAALGGLLLLAAIAQGPAVALGQVFDLRGHARVIAQATARLRRAGRLLAVTIGLTVLSWTGSQGLMFQRPQGRDDLLLLTRSRGLAELAVEQGTLAALTPLRDVAGLASNLPLLALATVVLFRVTAEAWGGGTDSSEAPTPPRPPVWAGLGWAAGALYILYRMVAMASPLPELPPGGCLMIEAAIVPVIMAIADGTLLAWVLTELREAGLEGPERDVAPLNFAEAVALMPGASVACLVALPARYVATAVLLATFHLPTTVAATAAGAWIRWQLGPGLIMLQAAALLSAGLVGAVAWTRGGSGEAVQNYRRMLGGEGARLAVILALAGLIAGSAAAAAYLIILALPAASWLLNAADSYAHYATLLVGLWTLAALIELAECALPEAPLIPIEPAQTETAVSLVES